MIRWGVSNNRENPQNGWFEYWKTLFFNGWFGDTIIFGNTQVENCVEKNRWAVLKSKNVSSSRKVLSSNLLTMPRSEFICVAAVPAAAPGDTSILLTYAPAYA